MTVVAIVVAFGAHPSIVFLTTGLFPSLDVAF